MIPIQDTVRSRNPPQAVYALIGLNVLVFALELTLPPERSPPSRISCSGLSARSLAGHLRWRGRCKLGASPGGRTWGVSPRDYSYTPCSYGRGA